MNTNQQLEIQAHVDGQLPEADARRVERQIADDRDVAALAAELRFVRDTVRSAEPERAVPETREFYFSQIRRRITAAEQAATRAGAAPAGGLGWLRRLLAPVTGVALVAAVVMITQQRSYRAYVPGEVEVASEDMNAITFRSEEHRMTVVYLTAREPALSAHETVQRAFE